MRVLDVPENRTINHAKLAFLAVVSFAAIYTAAAAVVVRVLSQVVCIAHVKRVVTA